MKPTEVKREEVRQLQSVRAFYFLVLLAVSFMIVGTALGNPFETYHNGSTL